MCIATLMGCANATFPYVFRICKLRGIGAKMAEWRESMKKLGLIVVLIAVLSAAVIPAGAVPTADLTALASHFPAETAVFFALRTDDDYIDTLDNLIDRVNAEFPEPVIDASIREILDQISSQLDGDFDTVFRTWLGDTAALGVDLSYVTDDDRNNDYLAALLAIEITDSAAAQATWSRILGMNPNVEYTVTDENGLTIYTPNTYRPVLDNAIPLAFADDYMLVGNLDIAFGVEQTLEGNDSFTDAINSLPNGDYNILLYADSAALFEVNMQMMERQGMAGQMGGSLDMLSALGGTSGEVAVGLAIADDRTLLIDFAGSADTPVMAESLGLDPALLTALQTPVDPAFAGNLPSNASVVMHIANLSGFYTYITQAIPGVIANNAEMMGGNAEESLQDINSALAAVQFVVRGATGLELEADILSWMTGDVVIWLGVAPSVSEVDNLFAALVQGLPVDFGLVIDASADPEKAARFVEGLTEAITNASTQSQTEIRITPQTIGGTEATVINLTDPIPIEIVIASDDDVFVLGTRAAAEAAFSPSNSLADNPIYVEASDYMLPNAYQVYYLSGNGLLPLLNLAGEDGGRDAELAAGWLNLIRSSSISTALNDGISMIRLTLTLSQ